ncbi:60S ribosomal protein L29-like [Phodopus roborovskii]|uniref:60S ribosomal protein L29-like n=1 Tax=Phodopus roborovskii TaxID=109678 RepID=UPI0021E361B5|nr:60S ribosomal protein L29-like [Phodopus roborovskii]
MGFAMKHKKGLKKMQVNNAKVMSVHAETIKALLKPEMVKLKMPKCPIHKFSNLAFIAHPKLGKLIRRYVTKDSRLSQPKPKVQAKAEASAVSQTQASAPFQTPKEA